MLDQIARLLDKRFDIYIEPPRYCATHYIGEIMFHVQDKWDEFSEIDREFIWTILVVDDSERPVLVNLF